MTLKQDLKNLKNKLTGDKDKDIATLKASLTEYDDRPYKREIIDIINEMITQLLPPSKDNPDSFLKSFLSNYDNTLLEIKHYLDQGEYELALKLCAPAEELLNKLIILELKLQKCPPLPLRFYFSTIEYDLAMKYYPEEQFIPHADPVSLPILKGQALFFLKDDNAAIESIRHGLEIDPVSADICFLLADIERQRMNSYSYLSYIERAKDCLYKNEDYIRYLKYLSDYYHDFEHDDKTATNLKTLYTKGKTYKAITRAGKEKWAKSHKKILTQLEKKKIDISVSDNVITTALEKYKECIKENEDEGATYYKGILDTFIDISRLD